LASGFFHHLVKGRFAGHPIHVMLVHFPSALYPFSIALDWIAFTSVNASLASTGYYSLLGAVATSVLAMIFGAIDLLQIDPKNKAWKTALLHGGLNLLWLVCFATVVGIRMKRDPAAIQSVGYLITSTTFVVGMLYSNFLGGKLVLKYGVGKTGN
jgi:uncharacterized membrane protein